MHPLSWTGLLLVFALSGCGTVPIDVTAVETARFLHEDNRHNRACDVPVPWATLNRQALGESTMGIRPLPLDVPRADFRTVCARGAEPVPCERQMYQRTDAVFLCAFRSFLTRFRPDQIQLALLSVEEVQTERDVLSVSAEPWRDTELSSFTPGDQTSLPFQVKAVRSRWSLCPPTHLRLPKGAPRLWQSQG